MSLPESGMQKTWESSAANQHGAKCVRNAGMTVWGCKSQNNMGTGQGEY